MRSRTFSTFSAARCRSSDRVRCRPVITSAPSPGTAAWWQLWKGLHDEGVDLIVTPYRGRPVETPWWRTAPNPAYREGEAYARARDVIARLRGDSYVRRVEDSPEDSIPDRVTREAI